MSFGGAFSQSAKDALAEMGIETDARVAAEEGGQAPATVAVRASSEQEAIELVRDVLTDHGSFGDFAATRVLVPIRMNLSENAYDFLNESLDSSLRAEVEPKAWKFAVFGVVQAIELLLKARLQAEHPALVYQNVDTPGNTVSMRQAVDRIQKVAKIELTERERRSLRKAQDWRDRIVHHEFDMSAYEVESVYVQLFEFLVRFHDEHTPFGSLHEKIDPSLWEREAELFEFFQREFVVYRGQEMVKTFPGEIVRAQDEQVLEMHGEEWNRLRYGQEPGREDWPERHPCRDCSVVRDEIHVLSCDWEVCPRCFGQLLSCGCIADKGPPAATLKRREEAVDEERRIWTKNTETDL